VLKEQVFARAQCQTPSSVQGGGGAIHVESSLINVRGDHEMH
jgi:hypothetical protein